MDAIKKFSSELITSSPMKVARLSIDQDKFFDDIIFPNISSTGIAKRSMPHSGNVTTKN
jgi:hypothetical protein